MQTYVRSFFFALGHSCNFFFLETIFGRIDKSELEGNRFETFIMGVFKMKVCVCPDLFILSKDWNIWNWFDFFYPMRNRWEKNVKNHSIIKLQFFPSSLKPKLFIILYWKYVLVIWQKEMVTELFFSITYYI